jgi:hypothetical protein
MARIIPADLSFLNGSAPAEMDTLRRLRDELPDTFTVFHGIHWTRERHDWCLFGEIDFVVVNALGHLLVIEQKNGAVEETGTALIKHYGAKTKNVAEQVHRSIDALRDKFKRCCPAAPSPRVDYLIFLPDHRLVSAVGPGLDRSRIVDATLSKHLATHIESLLGGCCTGVCARHDDVVSFLSQTLKLVPDVSSHQAAQERAFVALTHSLAETVRRIEFEPFRLRVSGAAGSGKSQLALDFCTRMARADRRPLMICFNRPLADRIRPLLPGTVCAGYHEFIDQFLTAHGAKPDFTKEQQSADFWRRLQEIVIALDIPESAKYGALVIDEGQDMQAEWLDILTLCLRPDAPILWLEDPAQNIYRRPPIPLPGFVTLRDPRNFRTPRSIARFMAKVLETTVEGCNPAAGLGVHAETYDDPADQPALVAHRITELIRDGFRHEDIVVISCVGREKSVFCHLDRIGTFPLKRFTGSYSPTGAQCYTEGRLYWDSLYRFKGQQAPAVILCDLEPTADPEHARRLLHCGMTRPTVKLELLMKRTHPLSGSALREARA